MTTHIGKSIPGFPQRSADLEDNLQGVEAACVEARLAADTMNSEERAAFPEYNGPHKKREYLYIRNQIISCWNDNPGQEVTLEAATLRIQKIEYQNPELINSILIFLIRRGRINHGIFKESQLMPVFPQRKEHIAIIGGGISGIIAAKQLTYFGFKVTLFEAMYRFGGRICTYRSPQAEGGQGWHGELGAMVVTGLPGNPIHTLSKQFRFDLKKIRNECPLHADGSRIDRANISADKKAEDLFNKILEGIVSLRDKEQFKGRDYSLGDMVEKFLAIQEANQKEKVLAHRREIQQKYKELLVLEQQMSAFREKMKNNAKTMKAMVEKKKIAASQNIDDEVCVYHYYYSKNKVELMEKYDTYEKMVASREVLSNLVKNMEKNPPPTVFMNSFERRMIDWHIANLEYANAASINQLSMKNWDQDDSYEFPGDHYVISNGYDYVIDQLAQKGKDVGVEFKLGHMCRKVKLVPEEGKVELTVTECDTGEPKEKRPNIDNTDFPDEKTNVYDFDAVLCTIPLGVLKSNNVAFEPPLPLWKQESINRLGFGNLNKLILHFEERFWEDKLDTFGCLGPSSSSRGEYYLFFSTTKKEPVLTVLLSGESANVVEDCSDDLIVRRAIILLKEIFGAKHVTRTKLKSYYISRWKKNLHIKGAYSYMAVGASGNDYEYLAAPVEDGQTGIYFAGEHTNRHYPATVHGAYLSGLREAGRIADNYCPTPYKVNKSVRPE